MSPEPRTLRFAWWNLHDFAHFDPKRAGERRWPLEQAEYAAKCDRVDRALQDLVDRASPDILGLCEVTRPAAEGLRDRLFPNYDVVSTHVGPAAPRKREAAFQIAVLHRRVPEFRGQLPLYADNVPSTTRGMAIVDHILVGHCIRFVFCHWTAFGETSHVSRDRIAEAVSSHAYEFLTRRRKDSRRPHVVILGDLNTEPFHELFREHLHASRDRDRSRLRPHVSDRDVRRVRLYNAGWRLLGERHPHRPDAEPGANVAGTYYNARERAWYTLDQVIVSGGLLGGSPPFLDEGSFGIMPLNGCLDADGKPRAFSWVDNRGTGLSDHLPLSGVITLPRG